MIRVVSTDALEGPVIDADDLSVAIEIADQQAPWNAGVWRSTAEKGVLSVEQPSDRADLRCGIGPPSSVLSGFTCFSEMIAVGGIRAFPSYARQDLPRMTSFLADYF